MIENSWTIRDRCDHCGKYFYLPLEKKNVATRKKIPLLCAECTVDNHIQQLEESIGEKLS